MNKNTYIKDNSICLNKHSKQSGFSLIEVLVAALILSIGILGLVGLQVVGLKGTQQSHMKHQAMTVIQNLTERMKSNKAGVFANDYLTAANPVNCNTTVVSCSAANSACDSATLAKADLHNLVCGYQAAGASRTGGLKNISATDINTFVDGELEVTCPSNDCSSGDIGIRVNWKERAIGEETVVDDFLIINTRISQ